MRFQRIIVLGNGKIASDCLFEIVSLVDREKVIVIESQHNSFSMLKNDCKRAGIVYYSEEKIIELVEQFIIPDTLIISANNMVIFPKELCERKDVEMINFHYSFLPDYRGVNIPSWVIYNGENYTGVTWHYVNETIDGGEIIAQEKIDINEKTTALDIVQTGMKVGKTIFKNIIPMLLEKKIIGKMVLGGNLIYRKSQLPNDGKISEWDDGETISRTLRAYDYGAAQLLGGLMYKCGGSCKMIRKYSIYKRGVFVAGVGLRDYDVELEKGEYIFQLLLDKGE